MKLNRLIWNDWLQGINAWIKFQAYIVNKSATQFDSILNTKVVRSGNS